MEHFTYKGKEFDYIDSTHNTTRANERCVELALVKNFLETHNNVVEIGAVSPYYFGEYIHKVYDLEDKHPRAENVDASDMSFKKKDVLCISTVEHFKENSLIFVERIIKEANSYLITFPLGYNERLDSEEKLDKWAYVNANFIGRLDLEENKDIWVEKSTLTDEEKKYTPRHWANTVVIIENFI